MAAEPPVPNDPRAGREVDELGIPSRTTPTWEIEILLSGATVFALFQLYGLVHAGAFWVTERLPQEVAASLSPIGLYLQGGVLALALGFIAHLALRALWVSAVGLKSVDPEGRSRESPTLGPARRELFARRWDALPEHIATLDDLATLVFALAIGLARMMLGLIALVSLAAVLAGLAQSFDGAPSMSIILLIVVALVLAPLLVATSADDRARRRAQPASGWVRRVIGFYSAIGFSSERNLALHAFTYRVSGGSGRRSQIAVGLLVGVLVTLALAIPMLQHRGLGGALAVGYPRFREADADVVLPAHYLDRIPADTALRAPALPTALVHGPYATLFIPYVPEWQSSTMEACTPAGDARWQADPAASRAVLDCVAKAQPIRLNGAPLAARWWWSQDQRRDRRGFEVWVDVRALAPGAHVIEIERPAGDRLDDEGKPRGPWRIPFWR